LHCSQQQEQKTKQQPRSQLKRQPALVPRAMWLRIQLVVFPHTPNGKGVYIAYIYSSLQGMPLTWLPLDGGVAALF